MKLFILLGFLLGATTFADQYNFKAPVVGTATTSSTLIVARNSLRSYLVIQNNSSSVNIVVKFNSASGSATDGVILYPGGSYEPVVAPAGSVYLRTPSSTAAYAIIEGQ